jgi:hypothetical protein
VGPERYDLSYDYDEARLRRKAFPDKFLSFRDERRPGVILEKIAKSSGGNPEDIDLLSKLDADGFKKLFKENDGPNLSSIVQTALRFGTYAGASNEMQQITKNAIEALRRIEMNLQLTPAECADTA